jgi:uncharacterized protein (DUF2384 family)
MPRHPDIDIAIEHIGRYAEGGSWAAHRREHLTTMLGPIPEEFGLDLEELFSEIREIGHLPSLAGFLDESFLAKEHGPDRANVIDDYLRRRGWQETPRAREYLLGMRSTPPALYEVQDVTYGEWIEVRDRLREEPARRVVEHSGSRSLQPWDCFVARIVQPRDEAMLTGGVLTLTRSGADEVEQRLRLAGGDDTPAAVDCACFQGWLHSLLQATRRPLPTLANTDGDPLLPSTTRLPVAADGAEIEVERRMDALADWVRDEEGGRSWTWKKTPADTMGTVLGNARLTADALVIETNSRERMERALGVLRPVFGALVRAGLTSHEDVASALRRPDASHARGSARSNDPSPALDPAAMAEVLNRVKDSHYRRTLDEPVPMLGNRTPRECARTKAGRRKLANWLKEIENGELRQAAATGAPPYDTGWMWRELRIEVER